MTDTGRRAGPAYLTADELAARTGTSAARIEELAKRGVLHPEAPDRYAPGDVHRVRVIGAFETAGITVDALVAAAEQGRISFAYYDELHPPPGPISPRTYGEFRTSLGRCGIYLEDPATGATVSIDVTLGTRNQRTPNTMWPLPSNYTRTSLRVIANDGRLLRGGTRVRVTGWIEIGTNKVRRIDPVIRIDYAP